MLNYIVFDFLAPKRSKFSKIHERGLDNGDFFIQNLLLFTQRITGGMIDYYGVVYKEKKQIKIRRSSPQ